MALQCPLLLVYFTGIYYQIGWERLAEKTDLREIQSTFLTIKGKAIEGEEKMAAAN